MTVPLHTGVAVAPLSRPGFGDEGYEDGREQAVDEPARKSLPAGRMGSGDGNERGFHELGSWGGDFALRRDLDSRGGGLPLMGFGSCQTLEPVRFVPATRARQGR